MSERNTAKQDYEPGLELIKPKLLQEEADFLDRLPSELKDIFQKTKSAIENTEKISLNESTVFYYYNKPEYILMTSFVKFVHELSKEPKKDSWYGVSSEPTGRTEEIAGDLYVEYLTQPDPNTPVLKVSPKDNLDFKQVLIKYESKPPSGDAKCNSATFRLRGYNKIYVSLKGLSSDFEEEYDIQKPVEVDKFAKAINLFLDKRAYHGLKVDLPKFTTEDASSAREKFKSDSELAAYISKIDRLNEDIYRGVEATERDRIIAAIELREQTDSNYRRPSWISQDERSLRGPSGELPDFNFPRPGFPPDRSWNS